MTTAPALGVAGVGRPDARLTVSLPVWGLVALISGPDVALLVRVLGS